jgi:hypothetical protein
VGKGGFELDFDDVAAYARDLYAVHLGRPEPFRLARERAVFGDRLGLGSGRSMTGEREAGKKGG